MKKNINKTLYLLLSMVIVLAVSILPNSSEAAETNTYYPTEKTTGVVKNPAMGWVLYLDAFGQMTNGDMPDINKGVFDAELFWNAFDTSGATDKASIFYIRAPWSFFEPEEGKYAWDHDPNYKKLINHALENDLNLAFRVYIDSQDSYQQATPEYVKTAGAKGYTNTFWTPYVNDQVFLDKLTKFIAAFGEEYDDPAKVDFIDGMGLGAWGEGHNIQVDSSQPGNVNTAVETITTAYRNAFHHVLLGPQQGGALASHAEDLVLSNEYDILRRDSFGMPMYFTQTDVDYYVGKLLNEGIPLYAENGWNYFAHDFEGYMNRNGNPFSTIRSMLEASLGDALAARANTFDFRVPEDAQEWMKNEDLVDEFIDKGGYRFVPVSLTAPTSVESNNYFVVESNWKNTGIGKIPNNRPAWDYKYKVAYALLDTTTAAPVFTHVTDIDPSEWLKGSTYNYQSNVSFGNVPSGTYDFAYAIVDTTNGNKPAINLAITDEKTTSNWYKIGQTTVSGIEAMPPKPKFGHYKLSEDWGSVQGENQWYYLEGNTAPYSEMSWDEEGRHWRGSYQYNVMKPNAYIHPDDNNTVVGWKAPEEGEISIEANPRKQNTSCGDGINIKIVKDDTQIWPSQNEWQYLEASDDEGIIHNLSTTVDSDDMIYFIVNKNGTDACDGSIWDPTIKYKSGLESQPEQPEPEPELINVAPESKVSTNMGTSVGDITNILNDSSDSWSSSNSATLPGYITFDLGDKYVDTEKITLAVTYGQGQGITNLDVQYHDGNEWVSILSDVSLQWNSNNSLLEEKDITFDSINTNKIRLKINEGNLTWNHIALTQVKWWSTHNNVLDLSELENLIKLAQSKSNDDQYTEASIAVLQGAISEAESVLETIETKADLSTALASLQSAIDRLETNKPTPDPIDLTELKELIKTAKGFTNKDESYTSASFNSLQEAITEAQASLEIIKTEADLTEVINALQVAIDQLDNKSEKKIEVGGEPTKVEPGSTVIIKGSNAKVLLPSDLPEGTTVTVTQVNGSGEGIKQAGDVYHFEFSYPEGQKPSGIFTLVLGYDQEKYADDKVKIYYYNEGTSTWELRGGDAANGAITLEVPHFSTYGVFVATTSDNNQNIVDSDDGEDKQSNEQTGNEKQDDNGNKLPNTATPMYNWIVVGIALLIIGLGTTLLATRRRH
ncbi:bifunctional 2',3'-cyclic nucleotide 2'-phosphodiesterase/3'-nucleotidase precursor protein [Paraliobacillus sp. PM-2]|uniref:discoidin domain-containing protein n=1 Tax=Paraliobacillus sp. PM-2 TaxID=1462524 RepID=UPI00061BF737|nr:DUF4832 domain-containing protein [Paraliobacillus sp. PM-2]CQR45955.1 bifunctional 2',3'-cyclic nucleotide 2'-phosphodiesterase/3'-nucleotidase precursor protein [Paraliobacillus sp. PM-2]